MSWTKQRKTIIKAAVDEEQAVFALMAICPQPRLDEVLAEARRRAGIFREAWQAQPTPPPFGTPLAHGLRSVAADVAAGRM